jgi:hypothetical protein
MVVANHRRVGKLGGRSCTHFLFIHEAVEMPRTVDGIVEAHRIAGQRRAEGRRVWDLTLDVSVWFGNEEMSFEQRRDAIVRKIRKSSWPKHNEDVDELLDELSEVETEEAFNKVWDDLYDIADLDSGYRVWIKVR